VVVVSDSVRREVIDVLGLGPDRVTTVYNGIDARFAPQSPSTIEELRQRKNLPEHYLLAVGTIEPRKNIGSLMRAFCDLPPELRERCPLVLAGGWGWKSQKEREYFETEARHRGVRHLGYVADVDLPALYGGATALLYPSHYEGFGLPPVEMLACGGAVIASTADAVREVLGPNAHFVEPLDEVGWRDAIGRAIRDFDFLEHLRRGGLEYANAFTWARAAEQTHSVYRRVLAGESGRAT
jgi:alpha-1,3-rhamnosyl/mannosyltransferase